MTLIVVFKFYVEKLQVSMKMRISNKKDWTVLLLSFVHFPISLLIYLYSVDSTSVYVGLINSDKWSTDARNKLNRFTATDRRVIFLRNESSLNMEKYLFSALFCCCSRVCTDGKKCTFCFRTVIQLWDMTAPEQIFFLEKGWSGKAM